MALFNIISAIIHTKRWRSRMKRKIFVWMTIAATIGLSGCVSSAPGTVPMETQSVSAEDFVYHGHNFGSKRNEDYRRGVREGCLTSDGEYTKSHVDYQTNLSYRTGWDHGRLHCKGDETP